MNLPHVRQHIAAGRVHIEFALPHALTEAFKDGLTVEELRAAVLTGDVIEDYGSRILLLAFTAPERIPYHAVVEYVPYEKNCSQALYRKLPRTPAVGADQSSIYAPWQPR